MRVELPIVGGFDETDPRQFSSNDLVNMFVAIDKDNKRALFSTPGLDSSSGITFATDGGIRNMYVSRLTPNMHVVVGSSIYQVDSARNLISGIELTTNSGYVGVDDISTQIMFVDGSKGYIFDKTTNSYAEISDPSFPALPKDVVAFGDRFYVIAGETNEIFFSEIGDGTSWDTLNKIEITTYPDTAVALKVLHGRLFVFGERCTEVWVLSGGSFPIARDESLLIEYGSSSTGSVFVEGGIMCWLGYNKQGITSVMASTGGQPERISTEALETRMQKYAVVDDASAFMYLKDGNIFYHLNFTEENESWLYNFSSKSWSRSVYKDNDRSRLQTFAFYNGVRYVGDYQNPVIYEFSDDFYSDDGVAIKREFTSDVYYPKKGDSFCCQKLRLFVHPGVGIETGNDQDPTVMLRLSRDSGATYGNQLIKAIGTLGSSTEEAEFYRLGHFEYGSLVVNVQFYNMTRFSLMKLYLDIT